MSKGLYEVPGTVLPNMRLLRKVNDSQQQNATSSDEGQAFCHDAPEREVVPPPTKPSPYGAIAARFVLNEGKPTISGHRQYSTEGSFSRKMHRRKKR